MKAKENKNFLTPRWHSFMQNAKNNKIKTRNLPMVSYFLQRPNFPISITQTGNKEC